MVQKLTLSIETWEETGQVLLLMKNVEDDDIGSEEEEKAPTTDVISKPLVVVALTNPPFTDLKPSYPVI